MIYFSESVKALGEGKVGGYLVRFGTPAQTDLEADFFSKETDLGVEDGAMLPVYYHHGMDSQLKNKKIGKGTAKYDDVGLWFEAQLEMRDDYERRIYEMAEAGKLGWSSGAAGHLVEREQIGKAWHIKSWVIGEASLTPTPAEPRNTVMPVKSLIIEEYKKSMDEVKQEAVDIESIVKQAVKDASKQAADEAIKAYEAAKPQVKAGYDVEVVEDEADKAVKSFTSVDFFKAVYKAAVRPYETDERLKALKATGLNEAIPSQGGFLVPPQIAAGIQQNMWGVGSVLSFFNPINVSGNSLTVNAIDETSRATGSRMGGVQSYWLSDGGTKTASKPQFRQIELKLKKLAALVYATDELLDDATALESWITSNVPNELRFMVEDAIINGDGVGKPLGILGSGALISAIRTDANEIDSYDVARMWASRYAAANDYVWLVNQNVAVQLYNMTLGNQPIYMPPGGISEAPYGRLLGRPVIETEYNPGLGSVGDILLMSPSQYAMITKGGVQAASSIHVQFVTDETAFRFVYRVDGQPYWSQAITRFAPSTDTVSPFVALAATT